jgi:predicted RNA-binding Zn ribbon-like protein
MSDAPFLRVGGAWILDVLNMANLSSDFADALSAPGLWENWLSEASPLSVFPLHKPGTRDLDALRSSRNRLRKTLLDTVANKPGASHWKKFRAELLTELSATPSLDPTGKLKWGALDWNHALNLETSLFLNGADPQRIRACANRKCTHLFYDSSKPGTRRWCDMGSCGNLEKVRRHRKRQP